MTPKKRAFTLIELVMTITLMGIVLIPLGLMSLEFTRAIVYSRDVGSAEALAKLEMAKINNLSYADPTLAAGYDNTTVNYEGYPYDLRRSVTAGPVANLKQVRVRVYPAGNTAQPLLNLLTYVANVTFGAGSGGGTAGGEADFLVASGGNISGSQLQNVNLQNTDLVNSITITGIIISFTGQSGIKLASITMGGLPRWSGNVDPGSTITLTSSFALAANTTYSNPIFLTFSKNLTSVTSLVFIMQDGTQTASYSW